MTIGKAHLTEHFARYRVKSPSSFEPGSFRTQHIGSHGAERVAGRLKSTGEWATEAILIPKKEYEHGERVVFERGKPKIVRHRGQLTIIGIFMVLIALIFFAAFLPLYNSAVGSILSSADVTTGLMVRLVIPAVALGILVTLLTYILPYRGA